MTGAMSEKRMRVVEYDRYGEPEVLTVRERPIPVPGPGQVLVRVAAAALNPKEVLIRGGKFKLLSGRRFPRRTGFDWSGHAVALGRGVRDVHVGMRLFGMIDGWQGGAAAEYLVVNVADCAEVPQSLDLMEASAVPLASLTVLQAYRDLARLAPGQRVLINGASGGVGTFAVQIARALGAEVEATTSGKNAELVRSLGAARVHDYETLDLTPLGPRFDLVFDVFGNLPFARARRALTPRGLQITTVFKAHTARDLLLTLGHAQRLRLVVVRASGDDLREVARLIAEGKVRPVIDRVYPLDEIAGAHRYLSTRRARGKVVVRIDEVDSAPPS